MITALTTGLGAFLYAAVYAPLDKAYRAWKADPDRERAYRRNWRGVYVPDLWATRLERLALSVVVGLFLLGLAIDFTIMS